MLKPSDNLIKNLGKNHDIKLESTSFQIHKHTHKKILNINVFLSLFLHYFTGFGNIFFKKIAPESISNYNCRIIKSFLWIMSSQSKGAPNEELHNILVHHIFFNVTTLLNSIEKKTIFKYHKMLKLEKIYHTIRTTKNSGLNRKSGMSMV